MLLFLILLWFFKFAVAWDLSTINLPKIKLNTESIDKMCEHPSNSYWSSFTGFKLYHHYKFAGIPLKTKESLHIAYCFEGKPIWDSILLSDYQDRFHFWNTKFQTSSKTLNRYFKFVRNSKFVNNNLTTIFPKIWVGAMLYCLNEECDRSNSVPVLPLYTDNFHNYWYKIRKEKRLTNSYVEKFIPFLTSSVDSSNLFQAVLSQNDSHIVQNWQTMAQSDDRNNYKLWNWFDKKKKTDRFWFNKIDPDEKYEFHSQENDKIDGLNFQIDKTLYDKIDNLINDKLG